LVTNSKAKWVFEITKIAIVLVLWFVNDEHIFSILTFMKDNLWNWLNQHLDKTLNMFAQTYFTRKSPLSRCHYMLKRWKCVCWCYHFRIHVHSMFVSSNLDLNIYVSMIMTSYMVIGKMVFISSHILLTFRCGGWDYELYWTNFNMKLELNYLSKCFCLVCKFELLNLNVSMSFFVCAFSFLFSNGTTFSTSFFGGCQLNLLEIFCGCHLKFKKKMNIHFKLFWNIHVYKKNSQ
jgi:hypothetical protein